MTAIAAAPRCRLYLTTPPELVSGGIRLRDFLDKLEPALAAADVACLLIDAPDDAEDAALAEIVKPLNTLAQARGIATLLRGRTALAQSLGTDGVHLDLSAMDETAALQSYRDARKVLGADASIGALPAAGRHMAMEIAELDADYVGFALDTPEATELLGWWGEIMNVPCVAFGAVDPALATTLAAQGADFIAPPTTLWQRPDPSVDLKALQSAIEAG